MWGCWCCSLLLPMAVFVVIVNDKGRIIVVSIVVIISRSNSTTTTNNNNNIPGDIPLATPLPPTDTTRRHWLQRRHWFRNKSLSVAHTDDTTREGENERIEYLIQLLHEFDFPLVPLFVHRHRVRHNIFAVKIFKWTTIFFPGW